MLKRYPCGGVSRRQFLASTAAAAPALACLHLSGQQSKAAADPVKLEGPLGVPGPYPGRVVEVRNPALIKDGVMYVQAGAGIVADSNPKSEQQECVDKAKALFRAAEEAKRFASAARRGQ